MNSYRFHLAVAATLAMAAPLSALAQPAPVRVRGTIESVDGSDVRVKSREGKDVTLHLAGDAKVSAVKKMSLGDVKAGSYVGIAAMPRPDGSQMALEVLVFPDAMRGAGEGHRAWDLLPESTMTNATVASTVTKTSGESLTLTYKDGEKAITVPPDAPVVTLVPADRSDLKPGAKLFASGTPDGDAAYKVGNVVVGRDGIDPPM